MPPFCMVESIHGENPHPENRPFPGQGERVLHPVRRRYSLTKGGLLRLIHLRIPLMCKILAVLLLVLSVSCLAHAQVVPQDSPAVQQMQGWLAAFNSGDRAT